MSAMEYQKQTNSTEQLKDCCQKMLHLLEHYEKHPDRQCLKQIQKAICNKELNDFEAVDEIIEILQEYGWNTGIRHDFG